MFKRNFVQVSSERLIEKLEEFFLEEGWDERLTSNELYAFRYALSGMEININNPSIIKRIGLSDVLTCFYSSAFIIYSENDYAYGCKNDTDVLNVCSNLDKRMIFIRFADGGTGNNIKQIFVYLPKKADSMLYLNKTYRLYNSSYIADYEKDFINDLVKHNSNLFKYHVQDEKILPTFELNYSKEFFSFTNLDIDGSTITFHYVP